MLLEEDILKLADLGYEERELRELSKKLAQGLPLDEFESMLWASVRLELGVSPLWFEKEDEAWLC